MPDDKEIKKKDSELDNFIANRKKKSIAIAVILFALVLVFFFTTVVRITSNIS
ncbi:MAG: hypothetical protein ACJ0AN_05310 [Alphaproteobacteria bacterium]|tara:strand:+ start:4305 stop:4463 length:159 start_codon:yes stop_codon:yes gene_type:complete